MKVKVPIVPHKERIWISVQDFPIYDISNKSDPLVIQMEALLAAHPDWRATYWQQQGPCSNWGYLVERPATQQEQDAYYNRRKKREKKILEGRRMVALSYQFGKLA